jgi:hypothetical protein
MFPVVAPAESLSAVPASDDIAGLATLYDGSSSKDEGAVGCGASVAGRTRASLPVGLGVAALFVVVAVVLARRGDRRARSASFGCVTLAAVALAAPPVIAATGPAKRPADGEDALAVVTSARSFSEAGLFHTNLQLTSTSCRAWRCPSSLQARVWGGTVDGVRQEIAGMTVPRPGERVAVAFQSPVSAGILHGAPLPSTREVAVRVVARVSR